MGGCVQDFIGVYSCESWELTAHFSIESYDCVEIVWSPDDAYVTVLTACCCKTSF